LYEQYGHWQDKVAWQGLLGLIPHEQIMEEMYAARRGKGNHMYGKPCYYKMTDDEKQQWKNNISKSLKGRKISDETRKKMSENNSRSQLGKTPWNKGKVGVQPKSLETKMKISKPVIYKGVEYWSIAEAARLNNTTAYYINKEATSK
jgi:hypothetical protein